MAATDFFFYPSMEAIYVYNLVNLLSVQVCEKPCHVRIFTNVEQIGFLFSLHFLKLCWWFGFQLNCQKYASNVSSILLPCTGTLVMLWFITIGVITNCLLLSQFVWDNFGCFFFCHKNIVEKNMLNPCYEFSSFTSTKRILIIIRGKNIKGWFSVCMCLLPCTACIYQATFFFAPSGVR